MTTMSQADMQSKVKVVSQIHQDLLQALPLIPVYLASGHPPHDAVDATCFKLLFNGRSKGVVEPRGAFAGLPAELWRIIFEKLCPACTSVITGPSVIARDISNAQLVCRKFYSSGVFAWSALKKLIQAEAGDFTEPEAGTNRQATRQLQELEMQRGQNRTAWPWPHKKAFSDDHIKILQQDACWEAILSKPQLYSQEGLEKALLCRAMQPFHRKSAGLQLYLTLRDAAQHVFGLQHPCAVPAMILLAVKHEKASAATDICNFRSSVRDIKSAIKVICTQIEPLQGHQDAMVVVKKSGKSITVASAFHFRRLIHSRARSIDNLLKLADAVRRNIPVHDKKQQGSLCDCEQWASPACEFGCCKLCCPGPCQHHKKGQVSCTQPLLCTRSASSNVPALKRKQEVLDLPLTAISIKRGKIDV